MSEYGEDYMNDLHFGECSRDEANHIKLSSCSSFDKWHIADFHKRNVVAITMYSTSKQKEHHNNWSSFCQKEQRWNHAKLSSCANKHGLVLYKTILTLMWN